jgi:hydroxymethylbilane synthase
MRLRLGTRGSKLALRQTELVGSYFKSEGYEVEIVPLVSRGDRKQGTPEAACGDKRDWIAGLEEAVLEGQVDLTVNSSKDIPLDILEGTRVLPVLPRASSRDLLVVREDGARSFDELTAGAVIGTASLRRKAFILSKRPELNFQPVRGNITTRLETLSSDSSLSGIVLAEAGLNRLDISGFRFLDIPGEILIPAVNQGTLAVQFDKRREDLAALVLKSVSRAELLIWEAEREVIRVLGADCRSAVGVLGKETGGRIRLTAAVCSLDGKRRIEEELFGEAPSGTELGNRLLSLGAAELLSKYRANP